MSERDDDLPGVPGTPDPDTEAREARLDALLSLSSTAPASLDARIAARRAAGDRVILPVEDSSPATPVRDPRRAGRTLLLSLGLAAAAALLLFMRSDVPDTGSDPRTPPDVAATDTPPAPILAGRDSAAPGDPVPRTDSSRPLAPPPLDIGLGFERTQPAGASFGARIERFSSAAIDSTVAAALRDPGASVEIRHPATSTELTALAERVERELVSAGIAPARIARVPYGATVMRSDVTIIVGGTPP